MVNTLNGQRVPGVMGFGSFIVGVGMHPMKWIPWCDSSQDSAFRIRLQSSGVGMVVGGVLSNQSHKATCVLGGLVANTSRNTAHQDLLWHGFRMSPVRKEKGHEKGSSHSDVWWSQVPNWWVMQPQRLRHFRHCFKRRPCLSTHDGHGYRKTSCLLIFVKHVFGLDM